MGRASYRSQVSDYGVQRRTVFLVGQGREALLGLLVFVQYAGGQIAGEVRQAGDGLPRSLTDSGGAFGVTPLELPEPVAQTARVELGDGKRPDAALGAARFADQPCAAQTRGLGHRGVYDLNQVPIAGHTSRITRHMLPSPLA